MDFLKRFRINVPVMTGGIFVAFTCFYMSSWQFARWEEKKQYFRDLAAATPDSLPRLAADRRDFDTMPGERLSVQGTFDFNNEFIVVNRSYKKRPGVKLITPMRISGSDRYILVDRGLVYREDSDPEGRKQYQEPAGETAIMVIARFSRESSGFLTPPDHILDAPEEGWFRMNVTKMRTHLPYGDQTAPIYFEQIKSGETFPISMVTDVLPPFRHLNYALQWISFGVFGIGFALFVQFRQGGRRKEDEAPRAA